jgi:hypothetical protein
VPTVHGVSGAEYVAEEELLLKPALLAVTVIVAL